MSPMAASTLKKKVIVISPLPTNHSKWSSAAKERVEMGALKEGRAQQRREKVGVMGGAKRNIYIAGNLLIRITEGSRIECMAESKKTIQHRGKRSSIHYEQLLGV